MLNGRPVEHPVAVGARDGSLGPRSVGGEEVEQVGDDGGGDGGPGADPEPQRGGDVDGGSAGEVGGLGEPGEAGGGDDDGPGVAGGAAARRAVAA